MDMAITTIISMTVNPVIFLRKSLVIENYVLAQIFLKTNFELVKREKAKIEI